MKIVLLAAVVVAQAAAPATMVDVGGHKLNVRAAGTARPGVPAVIFESGLGSTLIVGHSYGGPLIHSFAAGDDVLAAGRGRDG